MRVDHTGTLAALVLLRTVSGRSLRELTTSPPPSDLEAYRAPREAIDTVRRAFEIRGFQVLEDATLPTLRLEGDPALFASCFGVPESRLEGGTPVLELSPPRDISALIDTITLLRPTVSPAGDEVPRAGETPDLTGSTIGRFIITARLGAGGMGEVYRAEDTQLKRTVAIKRLTRLKDRRLLGVDLLREARRASALNHPRIASVYDVFSAGDETFLVMEYIDGLTLRQRLEAPLRLDEFCRIAIQCTEGLSAAHQRGIVHGDLKPANIMLSRDTGDVKVCDFGVARRLPQSAAGAPTTSTSGGLFAGTPGYMAPEVLLEQPSDIRADIFSLGVVCYEMLAGRNPFLAESLIVTLDRVRTLSPEPLDRVNPEVPAALARVVDRMIEKEPSRRYASAARVGQEIAAVRAQLPVAGPHRRLTRRRSLALPIAAAVLLAVLAVWRLGPWRVEPPAGEPLPSRIHLAVLPFTSRGAEGDRQFFTQGLTLTLGEQLSRLTVNRDLQVASPSDVRTRQVTSPSDARDQLGANVVLTGSLAYSGDLVRVVCRLIDTKSGRELASETFSEASGDPVAVQRRIVEAAASMTGLTLTPHERAVLAGRQTQLPGAYDFYLQARGYLLDFDRMENLDSAIAVFRKALAIDPRYALAYAGLGQAYWRKHELSGAATWVEPARGACEAALGISPRLAEPHVCLGMVLNGTGAYEAAVKEFGAALEIEPTHDLSYQGLATAYERLRRLADAEQTYRNAIQLRPHYWAGYNALGAYYYRHGRFEDARTMFQQVVDLAPDSFRGHSSLGAVYFMLDRTADAIASFQRSLSIRRNYVAASNLGTLYFFEGAYRRSSEAFRDALSLDQGSYQVWGNLASALEAAGDTREAATAYRRAHDLVRERLGVNPRDPSLHIALAEYQAALGDTPGARAAVAEVVKSAPTDAQTLTRLAVLFESRFKERNEALSWLVRAIEAGQPWREIDRSPFLGELRRDPRFQKLRQQR